MRANSQTDYDFFKSLDYNSLKFESKVWSKKTFRLAKHNKIKKIGNRLHKVSLGMPHNGKVKSRIPDVSYIVKTINN